MERIGLFLIEQNEDSYLEFISKYCLNDKSDHIKFVIPGTNENKLSMIPLGPRRSHYISPLREKGAEEMMDLLMNGDLTALIILNPSIFLDDSSLIEIFRNFLFQVETRSIQVALNFMGAAKMLNLVASVKPKSSRSTTKRLESSIQGLEEPIKTRTNSSLLEFLNGSDLSFLKVYYNPDLEEDVKYKDCFSLVEEGPHSNTLKFTQSTLQEAVELLFLISDENSKIKEIWNEDYIKTFFLTHTLIITEVDLFETLTEEFMDSKPELVIKLLKQWVKYSDGDLFQKRRVRGLWHDFCNQLKEEDRITPALELEYLFNSVGEKKRIDESLSPEPIYPNGDEITNILQIDPLELARQLTLIDSEFLGEVKPKELLGHGWAKSDSYLRSPNFSKIINNNNRISAWVTTEIIRHSHLTTTAEVISYFIETCLHLRDMKNYNGLSNIISSIEGSAISKRKKAFVLVKEKLKEKLSELAALISPIGHYRKYKEELASFSIIEPCIPIVLVNCGELNSLDEVMDDTTNNLINWEKFTKVSERIYDLLGRETRFPFIKVDCINQYIKSTTVWNDPNQQYAIAKLREEVDSIFETQARTFDIIKPMKESTGLSKRDFSMLKAGGIRQECNYGDIILASNQDCKNIYILETGTVGEVIASYTSEPYMYQSEVCIMFQGIIDGEDNQHIGATFTAESDCLLNIIDCSFVRHMCDHQELLHLRIYRNLAISLANKIRYMKQRQNDDDTVEGTFSRSMKSRSKEFINESDTKFHKNFGLHNENLLKEISCSLVKLKLKESSSFFVQNPSGTLFITKKHICFYHNSSLNKIREQIAIHWITDIKLKRRTISFFLVGNKYASFKIKNESVSDIYQFILSIWNQATDETEELENEGKDNVGMATEDDWRHHYIKASTRSIYALNEVILEKGEPCNSIFWVDQGSVLVVNDEDDYTLLECSIFGEEEFLIGGTSKCSIAAIEDNTVIYEIRPDYLKILFEYYPHLGGRFYHFLAKTILHKLNSGNRITSFRKRAGVLHLSGKLRKSALKQATAN
eukprot:TRINITY_DN5399_c0_g1_i1.p1 TRINITY_DN5399_c0_g1~~TRINITY_DN5399_c0_g1_i1.p1  ORF type:complete len:1074 (+),score=228.51 TRINITY_DN5399_c0_g1_i1:114-3224(+)